MDFVQILPTEICHKILSYLNGEELWNTFDVSNSWREVANVDFLWKRHVVYSQIDLELGRHIEEASKAPPYMCYYAKMWSAWRWGTVLNWEKNRYVETVLPSMMFSDYTITSYGDFLAISDGARFYVYTKGNKEVVTLFTDIFGGFEVRDIEMNKDYLIVLRNTCVVVYHTVSFKPYLLISIKAGRLIIVKDQFLSNANKFENSTVEFVLLHDHLLWVGEYLFLKSTFIIDLKTGEYREVFFPWKCTLFRSHENVIARTDSLLALYTLEGVKSFEMNSVDYSLLNTSKNVLALITDDEIFTYDRKKGYQVMHVKRSFFEFHINYDCDIIYGISRSIQRFNVVIEALSLTSGQTYWAIPISGEFTSEVRPFLGRLLCYDCTHSENWCILDARTGKLLHENPLPKDGRILHVSDLFWVCQTPENLFLRFY